MEQIKNNSNTYLKEQPELINAVVQLTRLEQTFSKPHKGIQVV